MHVEAPSSKLWTYALRSLAAVAAVIAITGLAGYLGWRSFELALHVDSTFAPPPSAYFSLGAEGLVPFLIYWATGAAGLAALRGVDVIVGSPGTRRVGRWLDSLDEGGATRLAAGLCLGLGIAWLLAVRHYWELFDTLLGLQLGTAGVSTPALSPTFKTLHMGYSNAAGWLTFALVGLGAYGFSMPGNRSGVKPFAWTALIIALMIGCSVVIPRRLAWHQFAIVMYENHRSFVIASKGDEFLLYAPDRPQTGTVRVRQGTPGLIVTEQAALLVGSP